MDNLEWAKQEMDEYRTELDLIETGFIKMFRKEVACANSASSVKGIGIDEAAAVILDAYKNISKMVERVEIIRSIYESKRKAYYEAVAREAQKEKEKSAADAFADIADEADKFVKAADAFTAAYKEAVAEGDDADHE